MVSATAVAAVLSGLESSASAASRPPVGSTRFIGTASHRTTGRIRKGDAMAMPANIAIVIDDSGVGGDAPGTALAAEPERTPEPEARKEQGEADGEAPLRRADADLAAAEHRADR